MRKGARGVWEGLLTPSTQGTTPRKKSIAQFVSICNSNLAHAFDCQNSGTVASRYSLTEKQRIGAVKVTRHRHSMNQTQTKTNRDGAAGNEWVVDPIIAGCVPFLLMSHGSRY